MTQHAPSPIRLRLGPLQIAILWSPTHRLTSFATRYWRRAGRPVIERLTEAEVNELTSLRYDSDFLHNLARIDAVATDLRRSPR